MYLQNVCLNIFMYTKREALFRVARNSNLHAPPTAGKGLIQSI